MLFDIPTDAPLRGYPFHSGEKLTAGISTSYLQAVNVKWKWILSVLIEDVRTFFQEKQNR